MREILFRGKCIETGKNKDKWLYGYLGADKHDEVFIAPIQEDGSALVGYYCDSSTIGQYVGKDKWDNDIFDGDIIISDFGRTAKVIWNRRKYGWALYGEDTRVEYLKEYKVIGNIHDNPELLEVE